MKVLIAGGAGFIGSTVASACLDSGITPVILDNLSTGRAEFVRGRIFYHADIADGRAVRQVFTAHPEIAVALHCAALVVVPESVEQPLRYYRENVAKSVEFFDHLRRNGCEQLLFSSSAAIYRPGEEYAVDESSPVKPANPYARTKAMVEEIIRDCTRAYGLRAISLRYFNPIGADPAMRTGMQLDEPTHVLGRIISAARHGGVFDITGTAWPTRDGSGMRDFIHVWDLALAHVQAIARFHEILPRGEGSRFEAVDVATGRGTTVIELLAAVEEVTGRTIAVRRAPPRPGDIAGVYSRGQRSRQMLRWRPSLSLSDAIRHALRWAELRDGVLNPATDAHAPLPPGAELPEPLVLPAGAESAATVLAPLRRSDR